MYVCMWGRGGGVGRWQPAPHRCCCTPPLLVVWIPLDPPVTFKAAPAAAEAYAAAFPAPMRHQLVSVLLLKVVVDVDKLPPQ